MIPSHSQSQRHDGFSNTRWSLVLRRTDSSTLARAALGELVERYGYPVYVYVRRCGHSPQIAQGITQTFLQHVMSQFQGQNPPQAAAHYREFLLARLHDFLGGDWRDTMEENTTAKAPTLPDMEGMYVHDFSIPNSPEQAFQRAFALEVLRRALARLREEAAQTGRMDMYAALEPFIANEPEAGVYEALAVTLHTRPLVLAMALKRLRQRLHELTGLELADTVEGADDLVSEQAQLLRALHKTS